MLTHAGTSIRQSDQGQQGNRPRRHPPVLPLVSHYGYTPCWRRFTWPITGNVTSSTKPEVHDVLHCRQRRTEPRSQVTCRPTENFVKFKQVFFYICALTDRHTSKTSKHVHRKFAPLPVRICNDRVPNIYFAPSSYREQSKYWGIFPMGIVS